MKAYFGIIFATLLVFAGVSQAENYAYNNKGRQMNDSLSASKTLAEGAKFLQKNRSEAGVQALDNGVQYKVLVAGSGAVPKASDSVTVMYEGKLIDGTVFDSSYSRKQPATFRVDQVIQGWQSALQKMPQGSTWMLYIPADLAYGARGVPGVIPPNSVLIFKVELQKIG